MTSGSSDSRWSHQANVERYSRLLRTPLTDREQDYVRRRLVEERQACDEIAGTEPQTNACLPRSLWRQYREINGLPCL